MSTGSGRCGRIVFRQFDGIRAVFFQAVQGIFNDFADRMILEGQGLVMGEGEESLGKLGRFAGRPG